MSNPHDNGDGVGARTLVVRLWLPDRPGALGQVASRIGAVRGDLLAIDILERGGGQVIDELVVSLPDETPQELLVMEIRAVDGVAVEHIRAVPADRPDPVMAMFELGAHVAESAPDDAITTLGRGLAWALDAEWVVITTSSGEAVFGLGDAPDPAWLRAFLDGSTHLGDVDHGGVDRSPADVMWARLPASGLTITLGRAARAAHELERVRLRLLARTVDRVLASSLGLADQA
jgi:hypothetical protein